MTSMSAVKTISFVAAAAAVSASVLLAPAEAEARRLGGTSVIEKHYVTEDPVKGYSGFVRGAPATSIAIISGSPIESAPTQPTAASTAGS